MGHLFFNFELASTMNPVRKKRRRHDAQATDSHCIATRTATEQAARRSGLSELAANAWDSLKTGVSMPGQLRKALLLSSAIRITTIVVVAHGHSASGR